MSQAALFSNYSELGYVCGHYVQQYGLTWPCMATQWWGKHYCVCIESVLSICEVEALITE
jgi:hypothetical protein